MVDYKNLTNYEILHMINSLYTKVYVNINTFALRILSSCELVYRVRWLLRKARQNFEDICCLIERVDHVHPYYTNMPWTDIMIACMDHKLTALRETPTNQDDVSNK